MPQYFNGADPTNAFAAGMMAGYDFIDRIKARNETLRLQKRAEVRDDQRFGMEQTAFKQRTELTDLQIQDTRGDIADEGVQRKYRDDVLKPRATTEFEGQQKLQGVQTETAEYGLQTAKDRKAVGEEMARMNLQAPDPLTLGGIGAQSGQAEAAPPAAGKPAKATPPATAPAPPVDLGEQQRQYEAQPGPLQRVANAVTTAWTTWRDESKAAGANVEWKGIANFNNQPAGTIVKDPTTGKGVLVDDIRRDLGRYAPKYLQDRDQVDPKDRATLDLSVGSALKKEQGVLQQQMEALGADAGDLSKAGKRTALNAKLDTNRRNMDDLTRAMSKGSAAEAGITKPTDMNDPAAVTAITSAGDAVRKAGTTPSTNQAEINGLTTRMGRMNPARLTPKQIDTLSRAYALGIIDQQTLNNWKLYGGPLAPAKPTTIKFENAALLINPDGSKSWIIPPNADAKNRGAALEKSNKVLSMLSRQFESHIAQGNLPDAKKGSGEVYADRLLQAIASNAQLIEDKTGIRVKDENGNVDTEEIFGDPINTVRLTNWLVNYENGADEGDEAVNSFEDPERLQATIPEAPVVQ